MPIILMLRQDQKGIKMKQVDLLHTYEGIYTSITLADTKKGSIFG